MNRTRRQFIRDLGLSAAAIPFVLNLPGMAFANQQKRKQRIIFMFSPNGIVRKDFWPEQQGADFELKEILSPLAPYQDKLLVLNGLCDQVRGDGDGRMRGIGCLLTGIELFPGNIQGGADTPAGWSRGISIDQEIKNFLQKDDATRTRFGSLEFGVMVPERADTWTRWSYAGPNKPIAPIDDPQQMFNELYGHAKDQDALKSVLDDVKDDLKKVSAAVGAEDRHLIDEHATFVREMEEELRQARDSASHPVPVLEPLVRQDNDHMPQISKTQIDLMINSFAADFTRVASMQYTNSVGNARMRWLGIDDAHHALSHKPNTDVGAQEKLVKIDKWFCEQLAYMTQSRLAETPEPGGAGTLLDNTLIVWTNELGEGNSHSLNNIPFVLVGNGLDFQMGRSLMFKDAPHNCLLLALAHGFGHRIESFGNPNFCGSGPLQLT